MVWQNLDLACLIYNAVLSKVWFQTSLGTDHIAIPCKIKPFCTNVNWSLIAERAIYVIELHNFATKCF